MIASIALCLALAPHPAPATQTSYAKIKDSYNNLSNNITALQRDEPTVGFRSSACFLGGELGENKSFTYSIKADSASTVLVVIAGNGNDYEAAVSVKASGGPEIAQALNDTTFGFTAKEGTNYTIRVTNKGADTFMSAALMKDTGGMKYPVSGLKTAVSRMAEIIQDGFSEGFGITPDKLMVLGWVMRPSENLNRATPPDERWMAFATSDGPAGAMRMMVKDAQKKVIAEDNNEERDCISLFTKAVTGGTITVNNPTNENHIVLTGVM